MIDNQHWQLVNLTNELFNACRGGDKAIGNAFGVAMSQMVEYVRFHFGAEQQLLERIKFPEYSDHKKQHDSLVKNILEAAKGYKEGKKFVPHQFVRTLKDWIFGHIAVSDRQYAAFVADQKRKGLLTDQQIIG